MVAPDHNEAPPDEDVDSGEPVAARLTDPAEVAFDSVFDSVSSLYRVSGRIFQQLIGLEFRSGRAHDAHIEIVRAPERVGVLILRMRRRWGAVAHVRLAEKLPDNIPGLSHPERRMLVVVEIHAAGTVATAYCRVNRATREISRGALARKDDSGASASGAAR
jgi:hypothetical protein